VTQQDKNRTAGRGLATTAKYVLAGALGGLAMVFVLQNADQAPVQLFFWEVTAPGWLWLLGLFLVGVVVGSVFPWFRRRRK
jgi:uncharacterized integral membrane protein